MKSTYLLITNIWNERDKIQDFYNNIGEQTQPPRIWVWIDDGSNDESSSVIRKYAEKTTIPVQLYTLPPKSKGNMDTIGLAYNKVLPKLKKIDVDYMAIVDVDTKLPSDYFERICEFMDKHSNVGVCSGQNRGEFRYVLPMGCGKVIRWEIVCKIDKFWDLAPDSFLNIKAISMGYRTAIIDNLIIDSSPSTIYTSKGRFRFGRVNFYEGKHPLLVLQMAFTLFLRRQHATNYLRGYFSEWSQNKWHCNDPDVKHFYSLEYRIRSKIHKFFGMQTHPWSKR